MSINNFLYSQDVYDAEIENIILYIYKCYNLMLDNGQFIANNENKIRNRLISVYLNNTKIKRKNEASKLRFRPEVAIIDGNDDETGYIDIEVSFDNSIDEDNDEIIFNIECKRLDGKGELSEYNLNGKYINNGIKRFITEQYPSKFGSNGMIGFCVETFNIHENSLTKLNRHLTEWCTNETISPIKHEPFIENFDFTYTSKHQTTTSKQEFKLYHLMLDMTSILE